MILYSQTFIKLTVYETIENLLNSIVFVESTNESVLICFHFYNFFLIKDKLY